MRKFAEGTTVQAAATKGQIEDMLVAHGCDRFGSMADSTTARIMFSCQGISYLIHINLPDPNDDAFWFYMRGSVQHRRAEPEGQDRYRAELNRRWRALYAVIKAKLIAVDEGITTFEDEFLAHTVLAGGHTFSETYVPMLRQAAEQGQLPNVMALPGRAS